jgi:hypothetical protein
MVSWKAIWRLCRANVALLFAIWKPSEISYALQSFAASELQTFGCLQHLAVFGGFKTVQVRQAKF